MVSVNNGGALVAIARHVDRKNKRPHGAAYRPVGSFLSLASTRPYFSVRTPTTLASQPVSFNKVDEIRTFATPNHLLLSVPLGETNTQVQKSWRTWGLKCVVSGFSELSVGFFRRVELGV